ncbi:MAG: SRPBCC family protein [Chloroflexota bacterium]|nr:SRPBCC family protein [Chloroflexota bacterium]
MKSVMRVHIAAPYERVFGLAADIERWPEILPHYRYVRRVQGADGSREFAMGARRGLIPVAWRATQRPLPDERCIEFHHTGGVTRGMDVAWRFVPDGDGWDVSIEHELDLAWPLIGGFAAERVIGPQFIDAIAGQTLRTIKRIAEASS